MVLRVCLSRCSGDSVQPGVISNQLTVNVTLNIWCFQIGLCLLCSREESVSSHIHNFRTDQVMACFHTFSEIMKSVQVHFFQRMAS